LLLLSHIRAFDWHQSVTLDALERQKRPLTKVNKNSGAHHKNFNEDRLVSLLGKCRAMHLFAINIKCMQICIGVPSEKVHLPPIPAPINPKCTCFHFLLIFRLTDRENRMPLALAGCTALARQASPRPVQCAINNKHRSFCWLRLKMGRYQFFLQN